MANYNFLIRLKTTVKILLLPCKFSSLLVAFHGYFSLTINCIHFLSVDQYLLQSALPPFHLFYVLHLNYCLWPNEDFLKSKKESIKQGVLKLKVECSHFSACMCLLLNFTHSMLIFGNLALLRSLKHILLVRQIK